MDDLRELPLISPLDKFALIEALAVCDGLDVILQIYDDLKVPEAVYREIVAPEKLHSDLLGRFLAQRVVEVIECIGALGLLLVAKRRGKISQLGPYIRKLRKSSVFYGDELLDKVLKLAEE
jgi:hypothetical protein